MAKRSLFPRLGCGVGLRSDHFADVLEGTPQVDWFEATSENYMGLKGLGAGRPLKVLESVRARFPVVLHGVSLSIGSADPLNREYLRALKSLVARIEPEMVSDHLCWTGVDGENLHDLMPIPYTGEAVRHIVERVLRVQDFLGRRILLENVSSYLSYAHSEMTEWDFLREIAERADSGILLDVNNVYVSSVNHAFDPKDYLDAIPAERVGQIHLAGHSDKGTYLIDTHDHPVADPVWALYEYVLERLGAVSTLVEWDDKIPAWPVLEKEALKARKIMDRVVGGAGSRRAARIPVSSEVRP